MSILIWILIVFLIYSFVLVPVFMELALDKPKKTEDGRLRIKKNGFVIRFFYRSNIFLERKKKCFPTNICQLYKGVYWGIPFFFLSNCCLVALATFVFISLYCFAGPLAFIAGYMPNPVGFLKTDSGPFHPYEEIGNRKWIAPWKFVVPIGLVALIYFFYREIFIGLVEIAHPLSSTTAMIVYGSIVGLVFLITVINRIRKTESFVAMKETIVSFVKKMCKEIEIT